MDDVSLLGGVAPEPYEPGTGPRVRVDQVAYLPAGPKNATLVTEATGKLPWQLKDADGRVVRQGTTAPRGVDGSSGQNVHSPDFGAHRERGTGYPLVVDGETSRPFDIDAGAYERLRLDSAKYYYTQRSGIEIRDDLRPGYAHPAGHVDAAPDQGDGEVPCQPGVCDHTLDVTGGWYDAGDHGEYVVNGGISTWEVLSTYERARHARTGQADKLGDGTLDIPESGNGVPDILDEARWGLEFLLKTQVPEREPLAGMAHHEIHDEQWTGLPLLPSDDPQRRELHPPSTAATLNLAATAAQAARLYRSSDRQFATRTLAAARTAWTAAGTPVNSTRRCRTRPREPSPAVPTRASRTPARSRIQGCVGQFCFIDDIQSWSTDEHTITWNAALTRMASFVADQGVGTVRRGGTSGPLPSLLSVPVHNRPELLIFTIEYQSGTVRACLLSMWSSVTVNSRTCGRSPRSAVHR
ncbi:glycoside hydrolase family 9 protein [Streptomyces sp. GD-15H]|uniref:glycoside hydrolase family 9 protein n=1 Tax=Streptomyces sp. GD-15H TaxID=3129112 RepID=UPI00324DABC6